MHLPADLVDPDGGSVRGLVSQADLLAAPASPPTEDTLARS